MKDLRQTPEFSEHLKRLGWNIEKSEDVYAYCRKIPFIGAFIKIQRPEKMNIKFIDLLVKKYKPFQIIVEPKYPSQISLLTSHGFKQAKSFFVPSRTIQIDLTKSEKQLLREMHYKTRYNIRKTQNSKLKIQNSKDINKFADFWQGCARTQRGMFLSQKKEITEIHKAFGRNARLIFVRKEKELLSGILLILTKDTAYYMYAASSNLGKELFAPTLNAWAVIKLSKKMKCKVFDFEGIYDERFPLESWKGFTRFKKSFGGKEIEYPGTFQKFLLPFML